MKEPRYEINLKDLTFEDVLRICHHAQGLYAQSLAVNYPSKRAIKMIETEKERVRSEYYDWRKVKCFEKMLT